MENIKQHVMIVEDEKLSRMALSDILKPDCKVFLAKNGNQAIDMALNKEDLDLIIMDVMMEGLDGFEVCKILKQNPKTRNISIIFISALSNTTNKVRGFQVGGVDYITKPFQADEVIIRVKTQLSLTRLRKEAETRNKRLQEVIEKKEKIEIEREQLIKKLRTALSEVKTLQEFIPICANCKNIRNDDGYWEQIEVYIKDRTNVNFSHGICPDCAAKMYPSLNITEDESSV